MEWKKKYNRIGNDFTPTSVIEWEINRGWKCSSTMPPILFEIMFSSGSTQSLIIPTIRLYFQCFFYVEHISSNSPKVACRNLIRMSKSSCSLIKDYKSWHEWIGKMKVRLHVSSVILSVTVSVNDSGEAVNHQKYTWKYVRTVKTSVCLSSLKRCKTIWLSIILTLIV